jgi:hypothetical protein
MALMARATLRMKEKKGPTAKRRRASFGFLPFTSHQR